MLTRLLDVALSHLEKSISVRKLESLGCDERHEKTDLKVFVVVIPKEGCSLWASMGGDPPEEWQTETMLFC